MKYGFKYHPVCIQAIFPDAGTPHEQPSTVPIAAHAPYHQEVATQPFLVTTHPHIQPAENLAHREHPVQALRCCLLSTTDAQDARRGSKDDDGYALQVSKAGRSIITLFCHLFRKQPSAVIVTAVRYARVRTTIIHKSRSLTVDDPSPAFFLICFQVFFQFLAAVSVINCQQATSLRQIATKRRRGDRLFYRERRLRRQENAFRR